MAQQCDSIEKSARTEPRSEMEVLAYASGDLHTVRLFISLLIGQHYKSGERFRATQPRKSTQDARIATRELKITAGLYALGRE